MSQLHGADFLSVLHAFDTIAHYDPAPEFDDVSTVLLKSSIEYQFAYFVQTLYRALEKLLADGTLAMQGKNLIGAYFYAVRELLYGL